MPPPLWVLPDNTVSSTAFEVRGVTATSASPATILKVISGNNANASPAVVNITGEWGREGSQGWRGEVSPWCLERGKAYKGVIL